MTPPDLAEITPLPHGLQDLLDEFRQAYGEPDVRLLADFGDGSVCVYPETAPAADGSEPVLISTIATPDGPPLRLEVRQGTASQADVTFLARVLARALGQEREARTSARELSERYEEINLLYLISEILGSVISLPDATTRILAEVADVLNAKRASLWVYRPDEDALHLAAAVGEDGLRGPVPVSDTESATAWVFRSKQSLNLERGVALPSARRLEPRPMGREAFLSVPINYTPPDGGTRTVGVITLVGRHADVRFTAGDARLLAAIASQVGSALETQRLVQESLRQERTGRELELAHDLQLKLLPDPASFEGPVTVAARCVPAESVGGDFYQLFRLPEDRLGIMIGDVSSHGFPAALIMALVMSAVGIYAPESGAPGEVLRRVHRALADELESTEMYLSLFYGVLDAAGSTITYANAGHPQAFRICCAGGSVTRLGATGPPLGLAPSTHYDEGSVPWEPGDVLLLFTDGLSDAFGEVRGSREGENALIREVVVRRTELLGSIVDHVFAATDVTGETAGPDDRTMVLVRG
jgi:sigma-B regulation protein RsbU (phosphoserine phosphatase)